MEGKIATLLPLTVQTRHMQKNTEAEKKREKKEEGQADASWGLTERVLTLSEFRSLSLDSQRGNVEYTWLSHRQRGSEDLRRRFFSKNIMDASLFVLYWYQTIQLSVMSDHLPISKYHNV